MTPGSLKRTISVGGLGVSKARITTDFDLMLRKSCIV